MYSKLATSIIPAHVNNYYGARGTNIVSIIIHHMAGVLTADACARSFQNPFRGASSNYCIGYDGSITGCVDEDFASGCSNNADADKRSITIEVSNSETGGDWKVGDKAYNSLINLCTDICRRYNIKPVTGSTILWHSMFYPTQCPGNFLREHMKDIEKKITIKLNPKDASKGEISGVNILRYADTLVMYVGGGKTGTNSYGVEALINKDGIVTSVIEGAGNMSFSKGYKVLSGHGKGAEFIRKNIKCGYLIWSENDTIKISSKQHYSVAGENIVRATDKMVIYNEGTQAKTNPYGREVQIVNNKAVSDPIYGEGHMPIPMNGYVISGHGVASRWIKDKIKKGTTVTYNGKYITIG